MLISLSSYWYLAFSLFGMICGWVTVVGLSTD